MPSRPRGLGRGGFALSRLLAQAMPLRVISPVAIRVLAILLLFLSVIVVMFLAFRESAGEVGALTDSAATAIAVESEVINFMSGESPAKVPENWPARHSTSTSSGRPCGYPTRGTATYRGYPTSGVSISGMVWIFGTGDGISRARPGCGGVSVSGAGISYTFTHYPSGATRSGRAGGSCSGGTRFTCRIGSVSRPTSTVEGEYWYLNRWSISCPSVSYAGHSTSVSCSKPKPPKPPPTPTPLADPISATLEITSSPVAHSTYAIGETVEVKASFDEDITIETSSPPSMKLGLDSGGKTVAYDRMSGNRELYFKYTIAEGDSDVTGLAVPGNPLGGHVYKDGEKRRLVNSGLQSDPAHRVDGVRPRINRVQFDASVFSALKSGDPGYNVDLLLSFDEDVEVTGDPKVAITVDGAAATSTFHSPIGHTLSKSFRYVRPAVSGEGSTPTISVVLPGGEVTLESDDRIKDLVGNDAILTYDALSALSMTAFDRTGVILEGLSINRLTSLTNRYGRLRLCKVERNSQNHFTGCKKIGLGGTGNGNGFVDIIAQFDEAITGSAPSNAVPLDVTLDGGETSATEIVIPRGMQSRLAARRITFKYYVKAGEYAPGGLSVASGSLECDGGLTSCYVDGSNNLPSSLSHTGLPLQPQFKIDGVIPTITGLEMLSEAPGREGWYGIDDTIRVGMRFSEPVLVGSYGPVTGVTGNSFIPNFGGDLKLPLLLETYATTTTELLRRPGDIMSEVHDFRFMVRKGDNDPDGISVSANSLKRTQIGSNTANSHNNRKAVIHDIAYNHVCPGGIDNWQIQLEPNGPLGGNFEECDGGQDQHTGLAAQIDHKVDGTRPVLESVQFANTPADPDGYAIGEEIQVTVTFSERVWVYGGPALNLQVGPDLKTMTYYPLVETNASGTLEYLPSTDLTFVYVVEEWDLDTDGLSIPENAFNPMGAVIDDVGRNDVLSIAHDAVATDATRKVDGIRATIESARFISTPSHTSGSTDTYIGGDEIAVELTFSERVDTFPDGALMDLEFTLADSSTVTRQMVADGVTSTTTVVLRYTVTDHDLGTGMKIPANPFGRPVSEILELLEATTSTTTETELQIEAVPAQNIVDGVGNASEMSMSGLAPDPNRQTNVDGVPPIIATSDDAIAIVSSVAAGLTAYGIDREVAVDVLFTEPVVVAGGPTIRMDILGTSVDLLYGASDDVLDTGMNTMQFAWTVVEGAQDVDGVSVPAGDIVLNGGTITDLVGNPAVDLGHAGLADDPDHLVDGIRPVVNDLHLLSNPESGYLIKGDVVLIGVDFSENVTHAGPAGRQQLGIDMAIGSTSTTAILDETVSSGDMLVFSHTVGLDDEDADGLEVPAGDFLIGADAAIVDGAGNAMATPTYPALTLAEGSSPPRVDGIPPVILGYEMVSNPGADGYYTEGDHVDVRVMYSENIKVDAGTALSLTVGVTTYEAMSHGPPVNSTTTSYAVFRFTVGAGEMDTDGIAVPGNAQDTGVTDIPGNPLNRIHPGLTDVAGHRVDSVVPTIESVTVTSDPGPDSVYAIGDRIEVQIVFSEEVEVDGTPALTQWVGQTYRTMTFDGHGTTTSTFTYTVAEGDEDANGVSILADAFTVGTSTVRDMALNDAGTDHDATPDLGGHMVDGIRPTINSVEFVSSPGTSGYQVGDEVQVRVTFSETVYTAGTSTLDLLLLDFTNGISTRTMTAVTGQPSTTLTYTYTLAQGDLAPDGLRVPADSTRLSSGASITDSPGNEVLLNSESVLQTNNRQEQATED